MTAQTFADLLARPARLEPSPAAATSSAAALLEVDAATLAKLVELTAHMRLPVALVLKLALRALERARGRYEMSGLLRR